MCFCNPPLDTLNLSHRLHGNISLTLFAESAASSGFSFGCFLFLCFCRPFNDMLAFGHQLQLYRLLLSFSMSAAVESFKPTIS